MNNKSKKNNKHAIIFQSLYLANLLLLPGVFFIVLVYYFLKYRSSKKDDNRKNVTLNNIEIIHLFRSIQLSVVAGILLVVIPLVVILVSAQQEATIMIALIYFVTLHATLVLIGMFNLSRAMAKKLPLF